MRYLRMLCNSIAAGVVATGSVLTLFLQLNPTIPLHPDRLAPLVTTVGLFYAVHLTVICYVLLVARQLFARRLFSPAWLSVGALTWLGVTLTAGTAALMWANLSTFERVLDSAVVTAMTRGALILSASSLAFLLLAWLRRVFGPEKRALWAAALLLIAGTSIAAPLAVRGPGELPVLDARPLDAAIDFTSADRPSRVTVIALDAASLDFITSATAEGRLPNFGRILDAGAVMHLATIHPTSADAVWASVATGKLPQKNGVRSASLYRLAGGSDPIQLLPTYCRAYELVRLGFLVEEPHTSAALTTRPLWSILGTHGFSVGVVAWPLTQPAPVVRGYIVSDTFQRLAETPAGVVDSPAVYPADVQADVMRAMDEAVELSDPALPASTSIEKRNQAPGRVDQAYDRIASELSRMRPAQVTLTRFQSLDPIGHYFLRYATPSEFGDVTEEERRTLGPVLERYYRMIDEAVGRAMAALGSDDLLLVVSGYGMEPLGLARRLAERVIGDADLSGSHDAAPDGFLMAYGAPAARGRLTERASVVDVTPTILYFLGLPIGRDMDGYARTDLFQHAFTTERPITFIPTYGR